METMTSATMPEDTPSQPHPTPPAGSAATPTRSDEMGEVRVQADSPDDAHDEALVTDPDPSQPTDGWQPANDPSTGDEYTADQYAVDDQYPDDDEYAAAAMYADQWDEQVDPEANGLVRWELASTSEGDQLRIRVPGAPGYWLLPVDARLAASVAALDPGNSYFTEPASGYPAEGYPGDEYTDDPYADDDQYPDEDDPDQWDDDDPRPRGALSALTGSRLFDEWWQVTPPWAKATVFVVVGAVLLFLLVRVVFL